MLTEDLTQLILKHNIISFDIFDTALLRPYLKPAHLFLHIEKYLKVNNFASLRCKSEKMARKEMFKNFNKEDITIDDIYINMPSDMRYIKDIEINFEEKILKQNKQVYEIYQFAVKNNKKIAFISDMYLPKSTLIKTLTKNGYDKFDYFYLSGEVGLTKKSGNLYKKFLEDEKLKPEEILHFGDNYKCDILMAQENNIDAYLIHKKSELFLSNIKNKRFKKLYGKNENSLEISIILALLSEKYSDNSPLDNKENYYYDFGYCIAGTAGYGLCKFISENTGDDDEVLCIARDGYNIEKILNIINPNLSTYYVYAQRILKNKLGIEENDRAKDFEANRREYKKYLQSLGIDFKKNIVIADTGAACFSAQRIIEMILNKKTLGLYSLVDKKKNIEKYNINCKTWTICKKEIADIIPLIEFIFMAPEAPVIDIKNNKPVYMEKVNPKEIILNNLAPLISEGMLDFVRDFMNRFRTIEIGFSAKTVNCYMQNFILNLSKIDKDIFKNNFYAANVENTKYLPLLRKIYKLSGHKQFYLQRIIYNIEIKILKKYKK